MASRYKLASWIVLGIVVQVSIILGTIYYMESRFAQAFSSRDARGSSHESDVIRLEHGDVPIPHSAQSDDDDSAVHVSEIAESPIPAPRVRELIRIERGSATEFARSIRELFGDGIKVSAVESSSSVVVMADRKTIDDIVAFVHEVSRRSHELDESQSEPPAGEQLPEPEDEIPDSNSVGLTDTEPVGIDPIEPSEEGAAPGNVTTFFRVRSGSPKNIATTIKEVFGASVKVIPELESQSVIVVADPATQERVSDLVEKIEPEAREQPAGNHSSDETDDPPAEGEQDEAIVHGIEPHPVADALPSNLSDRDRVFAAEGPIGLREPLPQDHSFSGLFVQDAEDASYDRQAKQLARRIREARSDERQRLLRELETLTVRQFEHRQQLRHREFESISQRLERLIASHSRRQAHQAEIVERRIKDLLEPDADLRWDEPGTRAERLADVAIAGPLGETAAALPRDPDTRVTTPKRESKTSDLSEAEPTYNGITLSDWLRMLQTERNEEKVAEAVRAMTCLADRADPEELAKVVFRTIRLQNPDTIVNGMGSQRGMAIQQEPVAIVRGLMYVLTKLPAEIVVSELLSSFQQSSENTATREFLGWFLYSLQQDSISFYSSKGHSAPLDPVTSVEAQKRLRGEIRRRSREFISQLVAIATRDERLTNWSIRCADMILRMSEESMKSYPELVPLAERSLEQLPTESGATKLSSPFYQGPVAALLLAESGLKTAVVLTYAEKLLATEFENGIRCVVAIAPHSSGAVDLLNKILDRHSKVFDEYYAAVRKENDVLNPYSSAPAHITEPIHEVARIMSALGEMGTAASPSLPRLKHYAESEMFRYHRVSLRELSAPPGGRGIGRGREFSLQDLARETIVKIEKAKAQLDRETVPVEDGKATGDHSPTDQDGLDEQPRDDAQIPSNGRVD
ncbi:hypothetical protein [Schlesneria sp. T3-172]|uniref:hypothetical protein n=1 Tax=Schlesneria sphaerica TaxID=3373610 RepID=UPI0037CBB4B5